MSEGRIIVNKHFANSSAITEDVFTKRNKQYREGEIVISNDPDEPGIFIMTHDGGEEAPGEVVNLNSAKNVKLSPDYEEAQDVSEVVSGDTIDTAVGKLSKQIKDVAENAMPNIGDGLKIEVSGNTKILSVKYDGETIIIGQNGELKAVGGGGDSKLQYCRVESHDDTFTGLDGHTYPAGIYLVLGFGPDGGLITYSYSDISNLVNVDDVYLTEEEYQELVDEGAVDPNVTYYTYED